MHFDIDLRKRRFPCEAEIKELQRVVDEAGSQSAIARKLNIQRATVSAWLKNGIPINKCLLLEKHFNTTCEKLRPDVHNWKMIKRASKHILEAK